MQVCYIHFYQKIARKKVARVNAALVNNRVTVIENRQKSFQLQLQLSTFENSQLQLQQNRVINYNFVNYNYNFFKPVRYVYTTACFTIRCPQLTFK